MDAFGNFIISTVATAPDPASSGTTLSINSADSTLFIEVTGTTDVDAVVWPSGVEPRRDNAEIIRLTLISDGDYTIARAQQGTLAKNIAVGWNIMVGLTAKSIQDILDLIDGKVDTSELLNYSLIDGSRPFTGAVEGVMPTLSTHLATKEYVDSSLSFREDFFFNNTVSDIGGIYYKMGGATGEVASTLTLAGLSTGSEVELVNFITDAGFPGVNNLKHGVYHCHVHAEKTAGIKSVRVFFKLYSRTSGGVETLHATSEVSEEITDLVEVDVHANVVADVAIATTDRFVVKWFAIVGAAGSTPTLALSMEGDTAARLSIPTSSETLSSVFIRQDGTKDFTGIQSYSSHPTFTADTQLVDKKYVDDNAGGGAVDSVNGDTGVVVLDQDDIGDGITYKQYSSTEKTKLAGIEEGAEVNDVNSVNGEVGVVVLNQDSIVDGVTYKQYSQTEKTKLAGIETGAQVNTVASVNGATGVVVLDMDDFLDGVANKVYTADEQAKLNAIEANATYYTDEMAQDAVGGIVADTDDVDLAYADATPSLTASLKTTAITAKTEDSTPDHDADYLLSYDASAATFKKILPSNLFAKGSLIKRTIYNTGSGTHTLDASTKMVFVQVQGGGGAGGGAGGASSNTAAGSGGWSGAYCEKLILSPSASYSYAVGVGGSPGADGGNNGGNGGDSTFSDGGSTVMSAAGGVGGIGMAAGTALGTSNEDSAAMGATGGDINFPARNGSPGIRLSGTVAVSGKGGDSMFGQGGGGLDANAHGRNGAGYGAGGGGSREGSSNAHGGSGGGGVIIVWEFA